MLRPRLPLLVTRLRSSILIPSKAAFTSFKMHYPLDKPIHFDQAVYDNSMPSARKMTHGISARQLARMRNRVRCELVRCCCCCCCVHSAIGCFLLIARAASARAPLERDAALANRASRARKNERLLFCRSHYARISPRFTPSKFFNSSLRPQGNNAFLLLTPQNRFRK